ncbi:MAG: LysR family transcriptional regulator [Anaerolineae bacterium]|jgi:LysR family transcriptional regulator, hydrogen peroxide-inducible genes activator|nr:LysR family transcriptional regulator [Anaerolineae bacterium]MBT7189750.1 LysR family transcriptional regulator [Anaerolineae bacterium]MBT7991169.1 LysR family transcriptional regulator [Anaerolineae bacterium]
MEIHQLAYFIAIVETGSFSKAAERCSVAQPSLSQQIKKLETEIGHLLFDRLGRRVVLTNAGEMLIPKAQRILDEVQGIKVDIPSDIEEGQGSLAVGFIPTISPFVLPSVIRRFSQEFPQASLEVHEDLTEDIVQKLVSAELDVGITSLPIKNKMLQTEELLTETLLVASSSKYDIASRASIQVKELDDFPFIALNEVHCLGEQVQSFCYQEEVDLSIVCHTSQLSTVHKCVAMGLGISLVPQALAIDDPIEEVSYRAISDSLPQRKIVAATHIKRHRSYLAQQFIEIVRSEYPSNHSA